MLCEGNLITRNDTPKLFAAARKSLDVRVENGSAQTPVFRGNTGWIMQNYVRFIHQLPALPAALPDGNVKGLRARGGFDVDLDWAGGKFKSVLLTSHNGGICKLKYESRTAEIETAIGQVYRLDSALVLQ